MTKFVVKKLAAETETVAEPASEDELVEHLRREFVEGLFAIVYTGEPVEDANDVTNDLETAMATVRSEVKRGVGELEIYLIRDGLHPNSKRDCPTQSGQNTTTRKSLRGMLGNTWRGKNVRLPKPEEGIKTCRIHVPGKRPLASFAAF